MMSVDFFITSDILLQSNRALRRVVMQVSRFSRTTTQLAASTTGRAPTRTVPLSSTEQTGFVHDLAPQKSRIEPLVLQRYRSPRPKRMQRDTAAKRRIAAGSLRTRLAQPQSIHEVDDVVRRALLCRRDRQALLLLGEQFLQRGLVMIFEFRRVKVS